MSPAPEPSLELLRRIHNGDAAAFAEVYRRYRDRLLLAIRRRLGAGLRANLESEDVLQSVVREALAGLRDFVPDGDGALGRYLHVCVLNKIRKKARFHGTKRRHGGVPLTDSLADALADAGPELRYRDCERFERLERALDQLPEPMRTVVDLRVCEGRTHVEIAQAIGRSEEAVRKIYQRAIARLSVATMDQAEGGRP